MRTQIEEWVSRLKTGGWTTFWVLAAYLVDLGLQSFGAWNLPTIRFNIDLATWTMGVVETGIVPVAINTALLVGIILNQLSKYIHNYREGNIE